MVSALQADDGACPAREAIPDLANNRRVGDIARKPPPVVPESKRLDEALALMQRNRLHMAVVIDEYGGTAGLVTIEDLIEEIVGDISDEHDRAESPLLKRIDGQTVEVDGRMYIDDLNDALGLDLPEDADYDTVAGFVFSELGFIPPVGESLQARGAAFTVLAADARKITRIRVQVPARHPGGE
jgi:CBS domain containing-hemolysin-like protein